MFPDAPALPWRLSVLEALERWPLHLPLLLLHSARLHPRWSRQTILATGSTCYQFRSDAQGLSRSVLTGEPLPGAPAFRDKPLSDLRTLLHCDPQAWWIGHINYDLARHIETLPATARDDRHWPLLQLTRCTGLLLHDTEQGTWRALGAWEQGGFPDLPSLQPQTLARPAISRGTCNFTRAGYEAAVQRCLDYIAAGDVFQVNLSQRFTHQLRGSFPAASRAIHRRLSQVSPAWYGAYLELPEGRCLSSTSPELFLEVQGSHVITRPIKGTRPASVPSHELEQSAKDQAELNMIVDLMRNDLGRVCRYGSIRVTNAREIESHPTVHHAVATIEGDLHPTMDLVDLLRATMPGGSVTGAPKVRAMQIIEELEGVRRGPYCGCIGILRGNECVLNIAIRTMAMQASGDQATLDYHVGGGIVADSAPSLEYEETLDKARAIRMALLR